MVVCSHVRIQGIIFCGCPPGTVQGRPCTSTVTGEGHAALGTFPRFSLFEVMRKRATKRRKGYDVEDQTTKQKGDYKAA